MAGPEVERARVADPGRLRNVLSRCRHHGRLQRRRRPVRVGLPQQGGNACYVRCRHRRACEVAEKLAGPRIRGIRRKAGKDVDAGCRDIGLQDIGNRAGAAGRKRAHLVAVLRRRQQETLVQRGGDGITRVEFVEDQVAVGLADHQRRNVRQPAAAVHDDRIAGDVVDQCGYGAGIGRVGDHVVEPAPRALDERDIAVDIGAVDEGLAGVGFRAAVTAGIERGVIVIDEHEVCLDRVDVLEWRREARLLDRVAAGNARRGGNLHGLDVQFAVARRCRGRDDPGGPGGRANRGQVRALVARRHDGQHARLGGCHQGNVVGRSDPAQRAADRIVDDVDAIGDRGIDSLREIRGVAARAGVTRPQPAGLVRGDPGTRCDALDVADRRAENRGAGTVSCRGGCDMRAVSVRIAGRANLAIVDRSRGKRAVDEPPGADHLAVAIGRLEVLAGDAGSAPVFGRVEGCHVRQLAIAPTQPATENRCLAPAGPARARPVGFAGVEQRRMLWRHATVDDADDDAVTVETGGRAQPTVCIEQLQERQALSYRHRANFVFPDVQDLGEILELLRLCRGHARGKPVQGVPVAVDFFRTRSGLREDAVLRNLEFCRVGLGGRVVAVDTQPWLQPERRGCRLLGQGRLAHGDRRLAQLHDVDLRLVTCLRTRELYRHIAGIPQCRFLLGAGCRREHRQEEKQQKATRDHRFSRRGNRRLRPR